MGSLKPAVRLVATHILLDRSRRQKCKRYISMKEHFLSEPKMLSFGCDEFIENVLRGPGRWWRGEYRGKRGLFVIPPWIECNWNY